MITVALPAKSVTYSSFSFPAAITTNFILKFGELLHMSPLSIPETDSEFQPLSQYTLIDHLHNLPHKDIWLNTTGSFCLLSYPYSDRLVLHISSGFIHVMPFLQPFCEMVPGPNASARAGERLASRLAEYVDNRIRCI
jgi:hypothetical protein